MPSKKGSIAYENRLARRRMDRRIKRLEKELSSDSISRSEAFTKRAEIREIQELRSATYFTTELGEKRSQTVAREAAQRYERGEYRESANIRASRNKQISEEISRTYYVDPITKEHIQNPASRYTEAEMRTFYRATQRAWEGVAPDKRIEAIMSAYNAQDLGDLIDLILSMYPEEVKRWEQQIRKAGKAKDGGDIVEVDEAAEFASTDVVTQTQAEIAAVSAAYAANHASEFTE